MVSFPVVPIDVPGDVLSCLSDCLIGSQVDAFVLDGSPDSFNKHVVSPGTPTVHGQFSSMAEHAIHKVLRRELATLIRVDNIWLAKPIKGFLQSLNCVNGFKRDSCSMSQYSSVVNINHRGQINIALGHADVSCIQCPNLIASNNAQFSQQVRIYLVLWVALARARLRGNGVDVHLSHQSANMLSANLQALLNQLISQLALTHERIIRMQAIHRVHDRQIFRAHGRGQVIHRTTADIQKLGLANNALFVASVNHLSALRGLQTYRLTQKSLRYFAAIAFFIP